MKATGWLCASVLLIGLLVNEHRVYLPFFGVLYALIGSLGRSRPGIIWTSWGLLLSLARLTWQRNEVWRDEFSLWSAAATRAHNAFRVQSNLGLSLYERGELEQARMTLERALELNPHYGRTWSNMGLVYEGLGAYPAAEQAYRKALGLRPDLIGTHANLGRLYLGIGRYGAAIDALGYALELDPHSVAARTNLGLAHQRAGRLDLAVRAYERTLKDGPLTAAAYNNLGLAYQDLGRLEAAETALERAVELGLENSAAAINLQMLRLRRSGRDALAIYEAMTLDYPYRPELWRGLAAAYAAKGRLAEAIAACRRIIALDPRDQQAIANLEKLLKNQRGD